MKRTTFISDDAFMKRAIFVWSKQSSKKNEKSSNKTLNKRKQHFWSQNAKSLSFWDGLYF